MENFNLTFPISMVKREERIVVGIATADNVDKAGDIVDFNASVEAFKSWQGNIREMHAPIAVGKAISYEPVKIKGDDGQEYNAMKVEAYISKGAQDTWEKVLDGTLRAFSIGGKILEKEFDSKKMFRGRPTSVIKKYILGELSLVDNPANQNAIIDIVKAADDGGFDYVLKIACDDIDLTIPESVKRVAQTGLNQRREHGRGGTSVGLGSARRLAAGGKASPEFVRKVARYFPRHAVDLRATGADPGEDGYPSNGRIAWNLWGGTPGWMWARSKVKQLDSCTTKFDDTSFEKTCSCGCDTCEEYDIINELDFMNEFFDELDDDMLNEVLKDLEKAGKTKRENGGDFPSSAFAYVPDPNMPSTWKLRLWQTVESKETAAQVGRAVAAIGRGFRGNVVDIPDSDMASVKSKIRRAWRKTHSGMSSSEMPDVLKSDSNDHLQNDNNYDRVNSMDSSVNDKLSLMKRFVNWLVPDEDVSKSEDTEIIASTESVEAESDILEEEMDIDILKEALGTVIDQRLTDFAASVKEEVDASMTAKIDELTKSLEEKNVELADKLASAEKALAEQTEKVDAFAAAGAMKKSVDPEDDDDTDGEELRKSEKSFWGNIYLPEGLIKTLGYKS